MVGPFYISHRKDFISVHEKRINNLRYADDTVIMTRTSRNYEQTEQIEN